MIKIIKKVFILLLPVASLSVLAHGQDIPAVTGPVSYQGFHVPDTAGMLSYGVSLSETASTGNNIFTGETWSTNISGDLGFRSESDVHPFALTYSGGYLRTDNGSQPSTVFQDLAFTQSFRSRRWNFNVSDSLSYLPDSPVGGLSGIPGLGDVGVSTIPPLNGLGILSGHAQRVDNTASLGVSRQITGSNSLFASGSYMIERFVGDATGYFSVNDESVSAGLNHRINALQSANAAYSFSRFTYPGQDFTFITQSISVSYNRQWTRRLSVSASGGPQITSRSGAGLTSTPASVNFSGSASLAYSFENASTSLSYARGVQSGSGVVQGSLNDNVSFNIGHSIGRLWHTGVTAAYSRNSSIDVLTTVPFTSDTVTGSVQVNRTIAESLSAYLSYSAEYQLLSGQTSANVFNGLYQTVGFGISYSPRAIHLGHQ